MASHEVVFLPAGKSARVETGVSLHAAAEEAGVHITSVCGGKGTCGTCRAIIRQGHVESEPTAFLTQEEVAQGYVLACRARVASDLVVEVPLESRWESRALMDGADAVRFGRVAPQRPGAHVYADSPLARKACLSLPPPSLTDHLADAERLLRGLEQDARRTVEGPGPTFGLDLDLLRRLPAALRAGNWQVTATLGFAGSGAWNHFAVLDVEPGDTSARSYGVAVDIGTTTVVAHLVDLRSGSTMATQARYNSQIRYGEDVISRIIHATEAKDGARKLQSSIVRDVNWLIGALARERRIARTDIATVVCAGNTTMTHLLLGLEVDHIRREPYIPAANVPPVVRAAELGIEVHPRGLLRCLPGVAAYVGGDITAGVLASGMHQGSELALLLDIGTNGEVVLGNNEWLMCCSASAGPSFEGGEMKCGMRAGPGAIERMLLSPEGKPICRVIGGGKPRGICGSGLIDCVAELARRRYVDRAGQFNPERANHLLRQGEHEWEFVLANAEESATGHEVVLTQCDIEVFLRSKGAVFTAADHLVSSMGLSFADVAQVYVAGGFGSYLDLRNAITIGLMPDLPPERFQFIGNGAVAGAKMCLLSQEALAEAERIAAKMTYMELSTDPRFMADFISSLFLPHTDMAKFPSVAEWMREG